MAVITGGFRGGGALTAAQTAALALLSASGGTLTVAGDLDLGGNDITNRGNDPTGLSAGESAVLAKMSVSGGKVLSTAPVIEAPASVADWSSLPVSWTPLSPPLGSALDRDTSVVFAPGGATFKADVYTQYLLGPNEGCMPAGVRHPLDPRLDALDVTVTFDSLSFAGLANYTGYVGVTVLSGVDGYGGFASARAIYTKAATGTAGNPFWKGVKLYRPPNKSAAIESNLTLIQAADGSPGTITLRLALANRLRTFAAHVNGTEMGGGSVATGAVDWTRGDLSAAQRTTVPAPLFLLIEFGTNGNSSPASSGRMTGFVVA